MKTNVLEALAKGGAMTAADIAEATGMGRATISSTLTRLARSGDVVKAQRGYQLPDAGATAPARTPPGATKATVLAALSTSQGATSGDVATATGLSRGTVSTTLSRLAKTGEVIKAERGYVLPG